MLKALIQGVLRLTRVCRVIVGRLLLAVNLCTPAKKFVSADLKYNG